MRNFIDLIIEADRKKENIKKDDGRNQYIMFFMFLCCCWNSEKQQHSTLDKKILCEISSIACKIRKREKNELFRSACSLYSFSSFYMIMLNMRWQSSLFSCCCLFLFFLLLRLQLKLQLQLISCNYWYDKIVLKERIDSNRKEKQRCLFDSYLYYTLFYFFTFLPIVRRLNVYF